MQELLRLIDEFRLASGNEPKRLLMSREQVDAIRKEIAGLGNVRWWPNVADGPIALAGIPVMIVDPETDLLCAPLVDV